MQIKTNHQTKSKSNPSLLKHWMLMTLPIIAAILFLPYAFILLGVLYSNDFHALSTQTILTMVVIQGLLVFSTPIVTAGLLLVRISRQIALIAHLLAKAKEQKDSTVFLSDEWLSIQKQSNQIGQAATQIKALFLKENQGIIHEMYLGDSLESTTQQNRTYQSLFSVGI